MSVPPYTVPPVQTYAGDSLGSADRPWGYRLKAAGVPVDLSGWSFQAQWRRSRSAEVFLALTVDASHAVDGIIRLSADPTVTRAMNGAGVWDVEGVGPGGERVTWLQGTTVWSLDVTRS